METEVSELVKPLEVPRKIWTREESHLLVELCFPNAEKLELIDGELIDRMGKKRPHVIWPGVWIDWCSSHGCTGCGHALISVHSRELGSFYALRLLIQLKVLMNAFDRRE